MSSSERRIERAMMRMLRGRGVKIETIADLIGKSETYVRVNTLEGRK